VRKAYDVREPVPAVCSERHCRSHPDHGADSRVPVPVACYRGGWPARSQCEARRLCGGCQACEWGRECLVLVAEKGPSRTRLRQGLLALDVAQDRELVERSPQRRPRC